MEPLKWKKYVKLAEYGLCTLEELNQDIQRYKIHEISLFEASLLQDMKDERAKNRNSLYVVKLVPLHGQGQLPNLRITKESDLRNLPGFLNRYGVSSFVEIWYCRTSISSNVLSVAGRLSFHRSNFPKSQIIELVWWCSPRLIEYYNTFFEYPYMRASRCSWGWHYDIAHAHIPDGCLLKPSKQRQDFTKAILQLERCREQIERFQSFLESRSQSDYSLEFKIYGSRLKIIDWDTPNDKEVIDGA